jgi:hypothetical protein
VLAFEAFIALVAVAAAFGVYRALRPRLALLPRPQRGGRAIAGLLGEPAGPRPGQLYVPDAGQLSRIIIRGMVKLGYQTLTTATRVLDPHVVVAGTAADIDTLRHFEAEVKAEIAAYVEQKGSKYRWTLNSPPTFTYLIDPKAVHGSLAISRAAAPATVAAAAAEPMATPLTAGWPSRPQPVTAGPIAASDELRAAAASGGAGTRQTAGRRLQAVAAPGRQGATRFVGGRKAASDPGAARLFRIGGGNIYHLKTGLNRLGRDPGSCDIVCAYDDAISSVHLEFEVTGTGVTGTGVTVRDVDSLNGTKINGRDLVGTQTVRHGDELHLGQTKLRLAVGNASLAPTHLVASEQ